ncbi:hypothetical protein G163CM_13870 [Pseudocitrobacter corydidari]|uniref:Uncharacterized protein n=2 Tax=Pseudocitrobacter corydidari TaxID=2891570 RepID=A0ABY3S4A4_9ENTR|nr:hypothetical protein G163CM_13870 [Pseudocitrobacter corydidari]
MLNRKHKRMALEMLLAGTLVLSMQSRACGPFSPNYLLGNRNYALFQMPNGSFIFEARHLVERDPKLPLSQKVDMDPVDWDEYGDYYDTHQGESYENFARKKRKLEIEVKLQTPLPIAERLYYLGARDFYHGVYDSPWFHQLLALPRPEQGKWRLKALYTMARDVFDSGEGSDYELQYDTMVYMSDESWKSIKLYQQVIDEVRNGEPDPEELSIASLGQLGFYSLNKADLPSAIKFYAQQAAQGSYSGKDSLRSISRYLTKQSNFSLLEKIISDPLVQKLIIAEIFVRHDWAYNQEGCADEDSNRGCAVQRDKLINLLLKHRVKGFAWSDRLAALAYRNGDYALTQSLLEDAPESGLREWLNAKMALRAGDIPLATRYYARAAKFFPEDETWGNPMTESDYYHGNEIIVPSCRIASEQAILALKRDDYLQAMALFYKGKDIYWADLADVAESVLTLPELQAFVDKNVPAPQQPLKPFDLAAFQKEGGYYVYPTRISSNVKLRALLARRLIRNGKYQQAVTYFDIPNYREAAQKLADLMAKAKQTNISSRERAQAQYEAARLLRYKGIELVAYEMYPDYAITSGQYSSPYRSFTEGDWISDKEYQRWDNALPSKENNFLHYRWQAAEMAGKAADLLHPKTQAWAAVLCNAASWVRYLDPETGGEIYRRYVRSGKAFDWAAHFGRNCPEPMFVKSTEQETKIYNKVERG